MNPIQYCWTCGEIIPLVSDSPDGRYCSRECCLEDHEEGEAHLDRLEARDCREEWR